MIIVVFPCSFQSRSAFRVLQSFLFLRVSLAGFVPGLGRRQTEVSFSGLVLAFPFVPVGVLFDIIFVNILKTFMQAGVKL